MVQSKENDRITGGVLTQIIAGRDGKPAFALVPIEAFLALMAYAQEGREKTTRKATRHRPQNRLQEDFLTYATRLFMEDWGSAKTSLPQKHLKSFLSDDRMENTFKEVSEWLLSTREVAVHRGGEGEDAEEMAAYDAAKARDEESFPAEIADRLIAGEHPLKVFREYRGLTQTQLAEEAETTAPYISQLETGRRTGSVGLLHRLSDALGVGLDDVA